MFITKSNRIKNSMPIKSKYWNTLEYTFNLCIFLLFLLLLLSIITLHYQIFLFSRLKIKECEHIRLLLKFINTLSYFASWQYFSFQFIHIHRHSHFRQSYIYTKRSHWYMHTLSKPKWVNMHFCHIEMKNICLFRETKK